MCTVANKQGGIREESGTVLTEQATGRSTACFSALEIDVLGEQELQSRCISHLFVFKNIRNYPRVRKKKRPVTPGVPARLDRHYICCFIYVLLDSAKPLGTFQRSSPQSPALRKASSG
jgi:hypothetical protein